jgi:hypothetical protein
MIKMNSRYALMLCVEWLDVLKSGLILCCSITIVLTYDVNKGVKE